MKNILFVFLMLISISCSNSEEFENIHPTDNSINYTLSVTNGSDVNLWLSFMGNKLSPGETSPEFEVTEETAAVKLRWDDKNYNDAITLQWDTVYVDMKKGSVKNVVLKK